MNLDRDELKRLFSGPNRKKAIALTVLVTMLAIVWGRNLLTKPGKASAASGSSQPILPDPRDDPLLVPSGPPVEIDWPPALGRNPFAVDQLAFKQRPVEVQTDSGDPRPGASGLKLNLTFLGDAPRAIINGRTLHVGETVEGFTVERIELRRVILKRGDVEVTLEM